MDENIIFNFNEEEKIQKINHEEDIESVFSSKYLNVFSKSKILSDMVTLKVCNKLPILIEYKIDAESYVHYYLAPKMDE